MKQAVILEQPHQDKIKVDTMEIGVEKKVTSTIDLTDMYPGHKMFEWDVAEGIIKPAVILDASVLMTNRKTYLEFERKPNCHYTPALNAQNAEKRFKKKFKIR
jgi:phage FluMu gp28-like protein